MEDLPENTAPKDPRKIFVVAEQFCGGAKVIVDWLNPSRKPLISMAGDNALKMAPVFAMCAFSFELYLKCLAVLDGAESPKGHRLDVLFGKLTADRQSEIRRRYDKERQDSATAQGPDYVIERVLERSANAFQSHRYIYEFADPREADSWTCQVLANTVRGILLEINPAWAGLAK